MRKKRRTGEPSGKACLTRRLSLRVTEDEHRKLKTAAATRDTFIQTLATRLIFEGIERESPALSAN